MGKQVLQLTQHHQTKGTLVEVPTHAGAVELFCGNRHEQRPTAVQYSRRQCTCASHPSRSVSRHPSQVGWLLSGVSATPGGIGNSQQLPMLHPTRPALSGSGATPPQAAQLFQHPSTRESGTYRGRRRAPEHCWHHLLGTPQSRRTVVAPAGCARPPRACA